MSTMASTRRHRRIKALIFRDGDVCFYCGTTFSGTGKRMRTIDHRIPEALGGTHVLENCVLACSKCNREKADQPEEVFLKSRFLQRRKAAVKRGYIERDDGRIRSLGQIGGRILEGAGS